MHIRLATQQDIDFVAPLFDAYRVFYKQESNLAASREFISERLRNGESTIYLAFAYSSDKAPPLGFTQVYQIFSSVTMQKMLLLNDLFVIPSARGKGIGKLLIDQVKELCKTTEQKGVCLQTAQDNPAQKLYEREGFKKDTDLFYFWAR